METSYISQISFLTSGKSEVTEKEISAQYIIDLVTKNKTEMCLRLLKQKKKSLIMNYIKDSFPVPQFSKKNSISTKIDSEIDTDIDSPICKHQEDSNSHNFFEENLKSQVQILKRSLSDNSSELSTPNEVYEISTLRYTQINHNETDKNQFKTSSNKLLYNYSYKYAGLPLFNKVILEKLAILTKAFKPFINKEQNKRFMELCNGLQEHIEINKDKLKMLHSDNIVAAICLIACKMINCEKKLFMSVINANQLGKTKQELEKVKSNKCYKILKNKFN